jgi:hypothetical protein
MHLDAQDSPRFVWYCHAMFWNWNYILQKCNQCCSTCRLILFCAMTSTRSNWDYFYEQHQLCRKAEEVERRVGPGTWEGTR